MLCNIFGVFEKALCSSRAETVQGVGHLPNKHFSSCLAAKGGFETQAVSSAALPLKRILSETQDQFSWGVTAGWYFNFIFTVWYHHIFSIFIDFFVELWGYSSHAECAINPPSHHGVNLLTKVCKTGNLTLFLNKSFHIVARERVTVTCFMK